MDEVLEEDYSFPQQWRRRDLAGGRSALHARRDAAGLLQPVDLSGGDIGSLPGSAGGSLLFLHLVVDVRSGGGGGGGGRGRQCGDDVFNWKVERRHDGEIFDGECGADVLEEGELSCEWERRRTGSAAAVPVRRRRKEKEAGSNGRRGENG